MTTQQQTWEQQQQQQTQTMKKLIQNSSGAISCNGSNAAHDLERDEEISMSLLSTFRTKEKEIEKRKMEVKTRVQAQLGRVETETKRLAEIREELEALQDPMRKEVAFLRKRVDTVNKELKPLGLNCQKKEREYKEAVEAFNEKNMEKTQIVARLMEVVAESEKIRMKKLEELSKTIESLP